MKVGRGGTFITTFFKNLIKFKKQRFRQNNSRESVCLPLDDDNNDNDVYTHTHILTRGFNNKMSRKSVNKTIVT